MDTKPRNPKIVKMEQNDAKIDLVSKKTVKVAVYMNNNKLHE